ncbi:hypothetical protein OEA41_008409 [Lepraria neglecta]|uniref:Uncharacterized protein n=1 Tax=Lepraria neglecta TaxID=209136 RepID=A0AAD9ZEX4_9LECA|nr:hypothetical protein OEA41_008409 [Lepraria neglecta]
MLTIAQADFTINAEIADWNDLFKGKAEEHQGIGRLHSQQYKVACDYQTFCSDIRDVRIPGTKNHRLFSSSHPQQYPRIRLAMVGSKLPGHEQLHSLEQDMSGLDNLVSRVSNFLITFKGGEPDGQRLDLAANVQFRGFLDPNPSKPGIIFEVAYLEGGEKAQKLLCTPDEPRPSVVVLFKFLEMEASRDEYEDMTAEVHSCDPEDESMTVIFETGHSLPQIPRNRFSLEEVFGNISTVNNTLHLQNHPEENKNQHQKAKLGELPYGFLELLKKKVPNDELAKLPIRCITHAVRDALEVKVNQDLYHAKAMSKGKDGSRDSGYA